MRDSLLEFFAMTILFEVGWVAHLYGGNLNWTAFPLGCAALVMTWRWTSGRSGR